MIEEQDIVSELKFYEHGLIMYVLGGDLFMNAIKKFMNNMWNFVSTLELYYNEGGYFIIRFKTKLDRDEVLRRGSYTIYRKSMFLHEWSPDFTLNADIIRFIPLWIILPQLPLVYLGERSIRKIDIVIGIPLMTDECTTKKLRVSYARVFMEEDVSVELKEEITIRDPRGSKLIQKVEYE